MIYVEGGLLSGRFRLVLNKVYIMEGVTALGGLCQLVG